MMETSDRTRTGMYGVWIGAAALGAVVLGLCANEAQAVRTQFFRAEGYGRFKSYTLEGVALSDQGGVRSGPSIQEMGELGARSVWRLVEANGRLVASTGDQGKLFRQDGEKLVPLATLHNYELFALTADASGNVYAAGAPSGTVVRVAPDGSTETLFTAPEGLILDLLMAPDGSIYAAAGERGMLYRIPRNGDAKVTGESGDLHLRTLAWSNDGKSLWAGTDGRGLLLSIDPESGERKILYDAAESEIVEIVPLPDGSVYFAANGGSESGQSASPSDSGGTQSEESEDPGGQARRSPARVYRLSPDGSVRPFWNTTEQTIHCLWLESDGSLLVGTSEAAVLYRIDPNGRETVLWRAEEDMILDVVRVGDVLYAATGNPGKVYRIGPGLHEEAMVTSEVLDARDQALWGKMSWEVEGDAAGVVFETRSGYTAVPDGTWSEWSQALTDPSGSQVSSPPGRYLQWRGRFLPGKGTTLRAVRVAHIEANRPPRINRVTLSPEDAIFRSERSGGVSQILPSGVQVDYSIAAPRGATVTAGGVPAWVRDLRSIVWEADDPDQDDLTYTIEIRQIGEEAYRVLERDRREQAYTLETGQLPDGSYEIRITASDAPSNAPGNEHEVFQVTPPFRVDNVPPIVEGLKTRRIGGPALEVSGTAIDRDSPVREIQVSIDGRALRSVPASDGLLDSRREDFQVTVPLERETDGSWVVVQVRDAAGNQGAHRAWLEP
jgi:hypothetical protein